MKVRAYIRVAKGKRGTKIEASSKPVYDPIKINNYGRYDFLPTVWFACDFEIPEVLFKQAEQVIGEVNIELKGAKVAGKMVVPEIKKLINDRENEESLKRMIK